MIHILYSRFEKRLPEYLFNTYLDQLPNALQRTNLKYRRWQDRHAHLYGKLLLLEGLKKYGLPDKNILNKLQYNKYSRPYLEGRIDFNISHSGEYVCCAIGKDIRLGVDIEQIKEIDFNDFQNVMNTEQWEDIMHSNDPTQTFFKYWTIKESVIKADSRGLSIPLYEIHINNNKVFYDNENWYLKKLKFDKKYCAFLASNNSNATLDITDIDFCNKMNLI